MEPQVGSLVWVLGYRKGIILIIDDAEMADNGGVTKQEQIYVIRLVDDGTTTIVPRFMFTLIEGGKE